MLLRRLKWTRRYEKAASSRLGRLVQPVETVRMSTGRRLKPLFVRWVNDIQLQSRTGSLLN